MGVDEVADELYALPPGAFTAARDKAAQEAPREQRRAIRALRRPTLAAWAVNLLVRADRKQVELLTRLGEELRAAHRDLDGTQLRELTAQQRQLVAALSRQAGRLTTEAGQGVSEGVLREVEATVHAALADPDAARRLSSGRLTKALPAPSGFGPVTGDDEGGAGDATVHPLRPPEGARQGARRGRKGMNRPGPAATAGGRASVTDLTEHSRSQERAGREREKRRADSRRAAEDLTRAARTSREEADAAEQELAEAQDRLEEARDRVHELTGELRRAKQRLTEAEKAERSARGPAERARRAAERDRERADRARAEAERVDAGDGPRGGRKPRRPGGA
ncbi:hypothetical protein [Streptomyces lycii]|uniref:Transposase n=1 Tax=Streptomyces lycii TaxID=2654337 RepID=A0ABQ7FL89_9ACTN|nr:hypothetical protein [Streptomyces lycii]KAF4409160.1 hypothetical protein GCU69_10480 [Streptomyces lycii]